MSIVTAKGKAAKESANKAGGSIDWKKIYIRLKDGDSVRVRLLSSEDYIEYLAHGNYNLGIYTQPCIEPTGVPCAICEAAKAELEAFKGLYRKRRYLFAMADIDEGMIRYFDATKGQAKLLIEQIEGYEESLGEVAFIFKRTGDKTETTYILSPILKMKAPDKEKFAKFDDVTPDEDMYETILQPKTRGQQIEVLAEAGFPVGEHFEIEEPAEEESIELPPINEEDIPF
jgi:hypothetical protein